MLIQTHRSHSYNYIQYETLEEKNKTSLRKSHYSEIFTNEQLARASLSTGRYELLADQEYYKQKTLQGNKRLFFNKGFQTGIYTISKKIVLLHYKAACSMIHDII